MWNLIVFENYTKGKNVKEVREMLLDQKYIIGINYIMKLRGHIEVDESLFEH